MTLVLYATLQSSVDGRTHWKSFTRPFTFDNVGETIQRVNAHSIGASNVDMYIRAQTYGQNSSPIHSRALREK